MSKIPAQYRASVIIKHDRPERAWRTMSWIIIGLAGIIVAALLCSISLIGKQASSVFSGTALDVLFFGVAAILVITVIALIRRRK